MEEIKNKLSKLKHWRCFYNIDDTRFLLMSNNDKLMSQIVAPNRGNDFKWLLLVSNCWTFDGWKFAPYRKYFNTLDDALDDLVSIDTDFEIE